MEGAAESAESAKLFCMNALGRLFRADGECERFFLIMATRFHCCELDVQKLLQLLLFQYVPPAKRGPLFALATLGSDAQRAEVSCKGVSEVGSH